MIQFLELGPAHRLARANYIPRVFGFAASYIIISLIVLEKGWSNLNFYLLGLWFLLYPQLVYLAARVFSNNKKVEIRAMMVDALVLGYITAHIHFSEWMFFAFLSATVLNSIMVGGSKQLLQGLAFYLSGILIFAVTNGLVFELEAPLRVELMAMLAILLYMTIIASTFYKQTRRLANIKTELEEKNNELEETLQELDITRNELIDKAHKAGMADVATGVLHNVGNILNSINASTSAINQTLKNSRIKNLEKANKLLREQIDDFVSEDPKKKMLLEYFLKIEEPIKKEYEHLIRQKNRLREKVNLIADVISTQQDLSKAHAFMQEVDIQKLFENTLTLHAGSIERHGLTIETEYEDVPPIMIEKTKVMHILFNILNNAKESMKEAMVQEKILKVKCWQDKEYVQLSITDNGTGIRKENIDKIFNQGFTTKKKGHGFGLHSSANYIKEMNGKIQAFSEGPGKGATFTLSFPKNIKKQ